MSTTARRLRPISRWISLVRPEGRPLATSRALRVCVARGSIEYSAVTQPLPLPTRNGGTRDSTEAATSTRVSPSESSAEPSANLSSPVVMVRGRSAFTARPCGRCTTPSSSGVTGWSSRSSASPASASLGYPLDRHLEQRLLRRRRTHADRAGDRTPRRAGPEQERDVVRLPLGVLFDASGEPLDVGVDGEQLDGVR